MSDHDAAPDPMDRAYAQAEAMLDDEAARAARRARVLGAVASHQAEAPAAATTPSRERPAWGRWAAAAGVAGLSVLIAVQLYSPRALVGDEPAPATPPPAAPPPSAIAMAPPSPASPAPAPVQREAPARPAPPPPTTTTTSQAAPAQADEVVTGSRIAPPPAAQRAEARSADSAAEVVTAAPFAAPPAVQRSAPRAAPSAAMQAPPPAPPPVITARLHAAAAAGRIAELTALMAEGAPVDARDESGETALMKAVRANQPAAAALLRRNGADLDLENRAGMSARDMAEQVDDEALNRALGLAP